MSEAVVRPGIPLDIKEKLPACDCAFWEPGEEKPWHYLRQCWNCSTKWHSLHCPHDRAQGECPMCHARAMQVKEYDAVP